MYTYVCTCIVYDQILFCKLGSHNNPRLKLVQLPSLFVMNLLYTIGSMFSNQINLYISKEKV